MTKTKYKGMMPAQKRKTGTLFIALAFAMVASLGVFLAPAVAGTAHTFVFTQAELDDNWEGDRRFPSGGVESVSAFERDNVAQLRIDSDETAGSGFNRTEGIKTAEAQDFGNSVEVDLYLDPAWEDTAVRAGLWVVGDDGDDSRDEHFAIIDFIKSDECSTCTSHEDNAPDFVFEGFRIWESGSGWIEYLDTDFEYGTWVTLNITLDTDAGEYIYHVDGEVVGTANGGENFIREVFLNSYNYGNDEFDNLNSNSYAAHWHGGVAQPQVKDECKRGGWAEFEFRNQGQCIRFVNTGQDSR